ncbi:MAG: hypothetical protein M3468_00175 [Acidobacteriota bacterium]|nr:hypothetical protein [Acidobacteriota bacterium]
MTLWLRSHWTQAVLIAVLLAVAHSWPLATDPAHLSLNYNGDVMLNEWIVAWVQHQLPRDPLHLFSANIFHPAPDSLAFSEPLIVPAVMGAPVRILGGSPVLVHNVLLLAGMALTMLGCYALVHAWTGDRLASLLAGSAWAFNTQSLTRLEHLQAHHAYGVPLALLAADRLIATGQIRHALLLAFWMSVMAYTSGYLVVFTTIALAVLVIVRRPTLRVHASFALAALLAGVAILPVYLPYRRAANEQQMVRTLDSVSEYSALLNGYWASYSHLHHWLWNAAAPRVSPDAYFPGIVVAFLALAAIALQLRRAADPLMRRRVLLMALICIVGCVLSLGTRTPVYGWLYAVFPPLAGLRAAARFGVLFMLGSAVLAGVGLSLLCRGAARPRYATAFAAVLVVLVNLEALRAPFAYLPFRGIPGIYAMLADEPGPVVLIEVPFYPPQAVFENAEYVLNSTAHWRPLMNGYSGYTPGSYRDYADVFWYFPDSAAVDAIRAAGATHLVLHPERFGNEAQETLQRALADPRLERMAVARNNVTLFRIK